MTEKTPETDNFVDRPMSRRVTREILIVGAFYLAYSIGRNFTGTTDSLASRRRAFHNARDVIHLERWFHIFQEAKIQRHFLSVHWLLSFSNDFYASAHFIVTIGVLVWLFLAVPQQYRHYRNVLAITTGLALIGFALFPLLPPRLLPAHYHFEDTLRVVGGLWNFDSGPINKISNQYAAMPSLHCGWALWSGMILFQLTDRRWVRVFAIVYPIFTVFVIVVTANHYFLDAVGGAVILVIAKLIARKISPLPTTSHL